MARIVRLEAASGSWDPGLAAPGPALDALLAKLRRAFVPGFLPQFDRRTGQPIETHIAGYVYHLGRPDPPIGFGLFKDFTATGYELWLVGMDEPFQGRGYGRAMLEELLATPLGKRTELARCALASEGSRRCAHLLNAFGFASRRTLASEEWLLHHRTPPEIGYDDGHGASAPRGGEWKVAYGDALSLRAARRGQRGAERYRARPGRPSSGRHVLAS